MFAQLVDFDAPQDDLLSGIRRLGAQFVSNYRHEHARETGLAELSYPAP